MSSPATRALRDRDLLAQVEVLVLFHPLMQSGGHRVPAETCAKATQGWISVDVHGRIGKSDLTGLPCIEDMRLEHQGEDIEAQLPENVVQALSDYVIGDE